MFRKKAEDAGMFKEMTAALGSGTCPGLSLKNRFIGAITTLGLAALWFFLAILVLGTGQVTTFAVYYTLGNVAAISCTMFIVGPARQCKLMTKPTRIISLVVFFGCMVLTVLVASQGGLASIVPSLVFAGLQFCAAVYYFMSFIIFVLIIRFGFCHVLALITTAWRKTWV